MCPSSFQFLSVMVIDSGFVPVISYSLLLNILRGHWIPITLLSCLLRKRFSFLWSSFDTPQFMQLYNSTLFTSVSYSRILIVSFFFQFFFQIVSFFARAIVTNSFLLWMTSRPPSFDPSFIMFLHSLTSSFDIIFTVVYSVFSSFTNRFLLSLFLFLSHRFCLLSFLFCDKVTVICIHYFLWDAAFHLFNSSGIYVFAIYWFFLHLTLYLFESSVDVQCEEWATDTVSLRWSYVRFKSGCLDFSTLTSRGVSASSVLKIRSSSS